MSQLIEFGSIIAENIIATHTHSFELQTRIWFQLNRIVNIIFNNGTFS